MMKTLKGTSLVSIANASGHQRALPSLPNPLHGAASNISRHRPQSFHLARPSGPLSRPTKNHRHFTQALRAHESQENDASIWATAISEAGDLDSCLTESLSVLLPQFDSKGVQPEIAVVFITSNYKDRFNQVVPWLKARVPSLRSVVGATGAGVMGCSCSGDHHPEEVEGSPAFSLTLARLAATEFGTFVADTNSLPDLDGPVDPWVRMTGIRDPMAGPVSFILLADPFFQALDDLTKGLDYSFPNAPKLGGLSSSGLPSERRALLRGQWAPGETSLKGGEALRGPSCVGLWMQGAVSVQPIIAQGCRALSDQVYLVTRGRGNLLEECEDERGRRGTPLDMAKDLLRALPTEAMRSQAVGNLMIAVAPDGFKPSSQLAPSDFLVRQLMGGDKESGSLAIGDLVRPGLRFRFVVRDKQGALDDLDAHGIEFKRREIEQQLGGTGARGGAAAEPGPAPGSGAFGQLPRSAAPADGGGGAGGAGGAVSGTEAERTVPIGALLFSCNGRGTNLFGEPNVDSSRVYSFVPVPSAGMFCNGELGPVSDRTHLHGFTLACAVIRAPISSVAGVQGGQPSQK